MVSVGGLLVLAPARMLQLWPNRIRQCCQRICVHLLRADWFESMRSNTCCRRNASERHGIGSRSSNCIPFEWIREFFIYGKVNSTKSFIHHARSPAPVSRTCFRWTFRLGVCPSISWSAPFPEHIVGPLFAAFQFYVPWICDFVAMETPFNQHIARSITADKL